jgi:hypothetical protein
MQKKTKWEKIKIKRKRKIKSNRKIRDMLQSEGRIGTI